ncbi:MAG: ABC transporter substrate-binding protein [bacterium]|nr:ABC transporter substrate-binding protein [bacterium]
MVKHKTRLVVRAAVAAVAGMVVATMAAGVPAAAATKSAFVVGFSNTTAGTAAFAGLSDGAQAAVQYVNAHGGINGHPLVLAQCDLDPTPEKNQACGQQFANDSRLKMVITGLSVNPGPLFAAVTPTGLPVLESFPTNDAEYVASNAVAYNGGGVASAVGQAEISNYDKAKTVTRFQSDVASTTANNNYFLARYKGPASAVTLVRVPATATDPLPYVLQGNAVTADSVTEGIANCVPWAKVFSQLGIKGTKVTTSSSCLSAANIQGPSGPLFEGWRSAYLYQDAVFGPITKDLKTLINEYPKYAKLPTTPGFAAYVSQGWGPILTLQNVLRGKPDSVLNNKKALFNVLHSYRGPGNLTASSMKCGAIKSLPALCTTYTIKGQVRGGKIYRVAG